MWSLQDRAGDWWSGLGGYFYCLPVARGALRPQGGAQQETDWEPATLQGCATALLWAWTALLPLPLSGLSLKFSSNLTDIYCQTFIQGGGGRRESFLKDSSKNHGPQQNHSPSANLLTTAHYMPLLPTTNIKASASHHQARMLDSTNVESQQDCKEMSWSLPWLMHCLLL